MKKIIGVYGAIFIVFLLIILFLFREELKIDTITRSVFRLPEGPRQDRQDEQSRSRLFFRL